jgi:uncharacterized protein with HEPN domain
MRAHSSLRSPRTSQCSTTPLIAVCAKRRTYLVERNFQIIGEALRRLERSDPTTAARISDYRAVIGLRNRLVHNYDDIDNEEVWQIIQHFLPILRRETELLVQEAEDDWSASESATG